MLRNSQSKQMLLYMILIASGAIPAGAVTIDDFDLYSTGSYPGAGWTIVDPVTAGSPTVQSNASNIAGKHLQFVSTWSPDAFDTIGFELPHALTSDGDYLQVAANISSGNAMASMLMQPGPFLPGTSEPWAAVGFDTHFSQFNHGYNTVFEHDKRFGGIAADTWYYLRATMRDAGGAAGVIDSYDFQVFRDAAGTQLVNQKLGIDFRNGYEGFISNIALRSFEQADQSARVLFDQITTNKASSAPPPARPADYGHQWVRNHPFTIFARAADDANEPVIQQLHLSSVETRQGFRADAAVNQGMMWIGHPSEHVYAGAGTYGPLPLTSELKARIADYVVQGGMDGMIQLDDEPAVEVMDDLGVIANWIRQTYPDLAIMVTAGWGLTPEYVGELMTKVKPDVLMYDVYPIVHDQAFDLDYHFKHLSEMRSLGQQYDVPLYAWVQALSDHTRRMPSESEVRLHAYSYLASGHKGLGYFRYRSNDTSQGLLNPDGQAGSLYASAAELNEEITHLGRSLRFLESTDIRYVPGIVSNVPEGLTPWSVGAGGDSYLVSMRVQSGVPGRDGMLGTFTDEHGQTYFMLVNLFQGAGLDAAQSALEFVLYFDADVDAIYRLNRKSGVPERIELFSNVLSLTLPGGTGDLFKYDDGYFPGIIPGDVDLDGDVDLADLSVLAASYGLSDGGVWTAGDFDLDGDIDLADLAVLAANYDEGSSAALTAFQSVVVPEPSALIASFCALPFLFPRRLRARANRPKQVQEWLPGTRGNQFYVVSHLSGNF